MRTTLVVCTLFSLALCQQTFQQFRFDLDPNLPAEEPQVLSQLEQASSHVKGADIAVPKIKKIKPASVPSVPSVPSRPVLRTVPLNPPPNGNPTVPQPSLHSQQPFGGQVAQIAVPPHHPPVDPMGPPQQVFPSMKNAENNGIPQHPHQQAQFGQQQSVGLPQQQQQQPQQGGVQSVGQQQISNGQILSQQQNNGIPQQQVPFGQSPQQQQGVPQQGFVQPHPQFAQFPQHQFNGFPQQQGVPQPQPNLFSPQQFGQQQQFGANPFAPQQPFGFPQQVQQQGQVGNGQQGQQVASIGTQQQIGFGSQLAASQGQNGGFQHSLSQLPSLPMQNAFNAAPVQATTPSPSVPLTPSPSSILSHSEQGNESPIQRETIVDIPKQEEPIQSIRDTPPSTAMWFRDDYDTTSCRLQLDNIGKRFKSKFPSSVASRSKDAALAELIEARLIECDKKLQAGHWDKVDGLLTKIQLSKSEEGECRTGLIQERISCYNLLQFGCQFVDPNYIFRLVPARIVIQEARQAENGAEKCRKVVRIVKKRLEG